jgi:hypothetical protein
MYCQKRANEQPASETRLRSKLVLMHNWIQEDPGNVVVQTGLASTSVALEDVEAWKLTSQRLRSLMKWMVHGGRASKEFFEATQAKSTQGSLAELVNSQGVS